MILTTSTPETFASEITSLREKEREGDWGREREKGRGRKRVEEKEREGEEEEEKERDRPVHQLTCVLFRFAFQKPREKVADAEALLDITNTLVTSVKAQSNEGVTARDFVSSLLMGFGRLGGGHDGTDESKNAVKWEKLGIVVSHVFDKGNGCCTMLDPMNSEVKQRKVTVHRKHSRLTEKAQTE
nr:non-structural maintenance of chromosomes element 4 homolog A [Tanacetum cinerariifolium]